MSCHPIGEYIADELVARGWTSRDLAERMGRKGREVHVDELAIDIAIASCFAPQGHAAERVTIGQDFADGLARAFGSNAETWMNLDKAYHECLKTRHTMQ